jgi:hypothetical protein
LNEQGEITELFQKLCICTIADLVLSQLGGNIVEIGAAEGKATVALAEIAKKHGAKVLVIDPYNGDQEGTETLYQKWKVATAPYDNIVHLRESSLEQRAIQAMVDFKPSFVFVDGLHYEWAAYSDTRAAQLALPVGGYVCVDDSNHLKKDAGAAFQRSINEGYFDLIKIPDEIEKIIYTYKSWHYGVKK